MRRKRIYCPCCPCCPRAYKNLQAQNAIDIVINFSWSDGTSDFVPSGMIFNLAQDKWIQTDSCGGEPFDLKFWCVADQWLFDLISSRDGQNYANPFAPGTAGGATLLSCNPFHLYGEITTPGIYADDFPFCTKAGSFPSGPTLNFFNFTATE